MGWARRVGLAPFTAAIFLMLVLAVKSRSCSKKDVYSITTTTTSPPIIPDDCTMLDLHSEGLGDEGIVVLAEALKTNTALKELNLQRNNMGVKGTPCIKIYVITIHITAT